MRWTESSDFGPKSKIWLGPLDSPIRFFYVGLHKKADPFIRSKSKNLKLGIGSRKNLPYFGVTMWWYRVDVIPILPMCPVRGYILPNFPKCSVQVSMLYRYRYQLRYGRPYRYRRYRYCTGIDVVPNLPKCPVPVLVSYRTYRRIRYRY